jgi:hypothetical protein
MGIVSGMLLIRNIGILPVSHPYSGVENMLKVLQGSKSHHKSM